jgi:hypothetical protein
MTRWTMMAILAAMAGCAGVQTSQQRDLAGGQWALASVKVQDDEVRFETDKLRFVGHVRGNTLSGTVTEKPAESPFGEFFVIPAGPGAGTYSTGSEWSTPAIP